MSYGALILTAGKGKRIGATTAFPKSLYPLGGKSLLAHLLETVYQLPLDLPPVVVYGYGGEVIRKHFSIYPSPITWVLQKQPLGTAHAIQQALPAIRSITQILILYGDVPLISLPSLKKLLQETPEGMIGLITATLPDDPAGYGRIRRDSDHRIISIVEEKEATLEELTIREVNSGIYLLPVAHLTKWLSCIQADNKQKEYYLTDLITMAVDDQIAILTISPDHPEEIYGINQIEQLARLEYLYQQRQMKTLFAQGAIIRDTNRLTIRSDKITLGKNVILDVNVILEGEVIIGDNCLIGPNVTLKNVYFGKQNKISDSRLTEVCLGENNLIDYSVLTNVKIENHCHIGPFAHLRPGTHLNSHVKIGNFVELKNSEIDVNTKICHLSYLGDSTVGAQVNIGAGTITCNYDGIQKHHTIIEDQAFIGSCTQLVAPVCVGQGAKIGAGSTIVKDAPAWHLTLSRTKQQSFKRKSFPPSSADQTEGEADN